MGNRISELEAEIERLREALRLIYEMPSDAPAALKICKSIARGALMPEEFTDFRPRSAQAIDSN